ncbi:MAG: exodeoxyribonuclease VII large subunit, partial [Pseudomonadota bacterium]
IVWPVRVQGETSGAEVANAVRGFNALDGRGSIPRPDTVIVARGGGSLEDLWGFNDEQVVRAVAASDIPVISAVGHETDWTLIDLVADARAPTPTKAAEWAVPKLSDLTATLEDNQRRLKASTRRCLETAKTELRAAARGLPRLQDLLTLPRQKFDDAERRLGRALIANTRHHEGRLMRVGARLGPQLLSGRVVRGSEMLDARTKRLDAAVRGLLGKRRTTLEARAQLLRSLSYQSVLKRGFALVRTDAGVPVRQAADLGAGHHVRLEFGDGARAATIDGDHDHRSDRGPETVGRGPQARALRRASEKTKSAPAVRKPRNPQGSLF